MLVNIFRNYDNEEFMKGLGELYVSIKGFEIVPKKVEDINLEILESVLKHEQPYLKSFKEMATQTNKLSL